MWTASLFDASLTVVVATEHQKSWTMMHRAKKEGIFEFPTYTFPPNKSQSLDSKQQTPRKNRHTPTPHGHFTPLLPLAFAASTKALVPCKSQRSGLGGHMPFN